MHCVTIDLQMAKKHIALLLHLYVSLRILKQTIIFIHFHTLYITVHCSEKKSRNVLVYPCVTFLCLS